VEAIKAGFLWNEVNSNFGRVIYKVVNNKIMQANFRVTMVLSLIIFTILFLIPTENLPEQSIFKWWDKAQHTFVFMALTTLAFLAFPKNSFKTSVCLLIYGGSIEVIQAMTSWRQGEFSDWVSDAIGILIIFLGLIIFRQFRMKIAKKNH